MPSVATVAGGASMAGPSRQKPTAIAMPDDRVADDDRPVGVERRETRR